MTLSLRRQLLTAVHHRLLRRWLPSVVSPSGPSEPGPMLPEPSLSFTLPSLHDDTELGCRLYHPAMARRRSGPPAAAVIAHPYAPLGGSADDGIVALVATTLLRHGLIVATFGFRGAAGSGGRTSWTARPETADYASVAGFLVYFLHHLHPPRPPVLLLAGYSYGALVTMLLPALPALLEPLVAPAPASAAAEIRHCARHLAAAYAAGSSSHVRVGMGVAERRSHDAPRRDPLPAAALPRPAYLLVSPLRGLAGLGVALGRRTDAEAESTAAELLACCPTLAVFGDRDRFVPVGRLRTWAARLGAAGGPHSRFNAVEVAGAGHFWAEAGVAASLREAIDRFVNGLVSDDLEPDSAAALAPDSHAVSGSVADGGKEPHNDG